ncbi:LacI family DNA-binding transcriptional regulator [Corynebacterium glyciniphilum]|uniref:LacI family DNA-binding transcriptional regulator n=1 Tax=Corynebacterium glyciniphilum TaxID=1404244 RepID=UPI0023568A50
MNTPATISDVASVSGVSRATVSLVLNDKPGPSQATREKVRDAAAELGYRPDVRARRLRGAPSKCVALLTTVPTAVAGEESGFSFQLALAVPLSRLLMARGYSMLLLPPLGGDGGVSVMDGIDVDAAVIIEPRRNEPLSAELRARGVLTVTVGDVPGLSVDAVVDRGYSGADVALGHLVDRGARNIGVLIAAEDNSVSSNVEDYVRTVQSLEDSSSKVMFHVGRAPAGGGQEAGRRSARDMLSEFPELDAIYAPTDVLALGVLQAARETARVVPDDLLVCTNFDGPRAREAEPPLTCLDLDMTALAEACVELLMSKVASPDKPVVRKQAPAPGLIARASTRGGGAEPSEIKAL